MTDLALRDPDRAVDLVQRRGRSRYIPVDVDHGGWRALFFSGPSRSLAPRRPRGPSRDPDPVRGPASGSPSGPASASGPTCGWSPRSMRGSPASTTWTRSAAKSLMVSFGAPSRGRELTSAIASSTPMVRSRRWASRLVAAAFHERTRTWCGVDATGPLSLDVRKLVGHGHARGSGCPRGAHGHQERSQSRQQAVVITNDPIAQLDRATLS